MARSVPALSRTRKLAAGVLLLEDTFTADDGTVLNGRQPEVCASGDSYTRRGSFDHVITGNEITTDNITGADNIHTIHAAAEPVHIQADVTIHERAAFNYTYLILRFKDVSNFVALEYIEFGTIISAINLVHVTDGVFSAAGGINLNAYAAAENGVLRNIETIDNGTSITLRHNNNARGDEITVPSTYLKDCAGHAGIAFRSTTTAYDMTFDNLKMYTGTDTSGQRSTL